MYQFEYGRLVRRLRSDKHITQGSLAELCQVSTVFICQIESGAKLPSPEMAEAIAHVFSDELSRVKLRCAFVRSRLYAHARRLDITVAEIKEAFSYE